MGDDDSGKLKQHEEMLWTTVRVHTDKAYGSGTVIFSGQITPKDYVTYIITCFHVISDNIKIEKKFDHRVGYDIKKEIRIPAEVEFFYYENMSKCLGVSGSAKADIVGYDEDADIALLELRRSSLVDYVAALFPKEKMENIHVFDEVWACGAALAHEPIATKGIVNFMNEVMESGVEYWMSNAQIIFGNSGGSMFRYSKTRDKYEFIGIPARIAVSGSGFTPDPITHMGYFVPIPVIYQFLQDNFFTFIYGEGTYESCKAQREQYRVQQEKLLLAMYGGKPEKEEKKK
jgi:S1-C subfamily serine protease